MAGTWYYAQPGCAFTSDNLLAKAGGEVAASEIKSKLASVYSSVGVSSSNTAFQFDGSNQFAGKLMGVPLSGTYTYDPSSGQINMKATLITLKGYVQGTSTGIALLFEGSKLLSIMQTVASMSGNGTLSAIGELSKNYFKELHRGELAANSDHYPFATRHVPCIFLENEKGDAFQYYHTIFDTYETVRFDSYEPIFKMVHDFIEQYK